VIRRLVLMADHGADPVWDAESGAMLDLDTVPVSAATRTALRAWARTWEPLALSDDDDAAAWAAWDAEGRRLWAVVRAELAPRGVRVGYAVDDPGAETVLVEWTPGARGERPPWFGPGGALTGPG
jgi:hypothetical protein